MQQGWSHPKVALILFPFAAGAMAVNVFFASLIGSWAGFPVITPGASIVIGSIIGVPVAWYFARHISKLMDRADGHRTQDATFRS